MREQTPLDDRLQAIGDATAAGLLGLLGRRLVVAVACHLGLAAGRGRPGRLRVAAAVGLDVDLAGGPAVDLRYRVPGRDLADVPVRVAVAVRVLEDDDARAVTVAADLLDHAIGDRDERGPLLGEDVDAAAGVVRVDDVRGVLPRLHALDDVLLGEVVGVSG